MLCQTFYPSHSVIGTPVILGIRRGFLWPESRSSTSDRDRNLKETEKSCSLKPTVVTAFAQLIPEKSLQNGTAKWLFTKQLQVLYTQKLGLGKRPVVSKNSFGIVHTANTANSWKRNKFQWDVRSRCHSADEETENWILYPRGRPALSDAFVHRCDHFLSDKDGQAVWWPWKMTQPVHSCLPQTLRDQTDVAISQWKMTQTPENKWTHFLYILVCKFIEVLLVVEEKTKNVSAFNRSSKCWLPSSYFSRCAGGRHS